MDKPSANLFNRAGHLLWPALLGLGLAALCLLDPGGQFHILELKTLDARIRAAAQRNDSTGPGIVLVDISEQSLRRLEPVFGRWPWPRSAHGDVVEYLARDGARAIAFDLIFSERTRAVQLDDAALAELAVFAGNADIPEVRDEMLARLSRLKPSAGDEAFAEKVRRAGNVVNPAVFYVDAAEAAVAPRMVASGADLAAARTALAGSLLPAQPGGPAFPVFYNAIVPFPELALASRSLGHTGFPADADGLIRRFRPLAGFASPDALYPSLPLAVAVVALGLDVSQIRIGPESIRLGERDLPLLPDGSAYVTYRAGPDQSGTPYDSVSYEAVLQSAALTARGQEAVLPPGRFKDKIVIVGATAVGLKDVRATPLAPVSPSFEISAAAVDGIVSGLVPRPASPAYALILTPLLCLACALLVAGTRVALGVPAALALTGAAAVLPWLLYPKGLVAPMAGPSLAALASAIAGGSYKYSREARDKSRIKSAFGQYLAPAVMEEILRHPEQLRLGGSKRVLTVLFSDIAGFTSLSENLPAERAAGILNAYFTRMAACVTASGGIVDKFIGDGLMAEWNAPHEQPGHAAAACQAALCMRRELKDLNAEFAARGEPALAIRIGLNTGEMIVGNMGAENIFDYSVIGDEVNTASRLEALGKMFGVTATVAESTAEAARLADPGAFVLRRLGRVRIKGRAKDGAVYELAGAAGDLDDNILAALADYERGLTLYEAGRLTEAAAVFDDILRVLPDDGPTKLLASLCRARPDGEFTGVIEQKEK